MSFPFILCIFVTFVAANNPQVYETIEDLVSDTNFRQVRDSFRSRLNTYQPPAFDYNSAQKQPDPRRHRYALQQQIDSKHILGKPDETRNSKAYTQPQVSLSNPEENERKATETIWHRIARMATTPKPSRVSRKLKPNSYYEDEKLVKRQDQNAQLIYVDPQLIKQHFQESASEEELQALNALIGKSPNTQLEGLKKILQTPQVNYNPQPFQQQKDHTPITEENPEGASSSPQQLNFNSLGDKGSLESIQAQLDKMARAHAEEALAKAQKEANAQVQAQHQAIIKQQADLQKAALAKIAAHNQQIKSESHGEQVYQHPLALPLKAEVVPVNYAPTHHHQQALHNNAVLQAQTAALQQEVAVKAQQQQAIFHAKKIQQENALKAQQESIIKAQNEAFVRAQPERHQLRKQNIVHIIPKKANLEKISVTKTHSVTQGRHTPTGFHEEVVLETQQQKVYPTAVKAPEHAHELEHDPEVGDHHQYASRYAFGYRIKDVKKGNDFGHEEKRDGKSAKGHYHVLLPDGRIQKVEYYADPTGYHAKVTYENLAHH